MIFRHFFDLYSASARLAKLGQHKGEGTGGKNTRPDRRRACAPPGTIPRVGTEFIHILSCAISYVHGCNFLDDLSSTPNRHRCMSAPRSFMSCTRVLPSTGVRPDSNFTPPPPTDTCTCPRPRCQWDTGKCDNNVFNCHCSSHTRCSWVRNRNEYSFREFGLSIQLHDNVLRWA